MPAIVAHMNSFDPETCSISWPKLICAGVGLKLYLSAGIASAAATRFRSELLSSFFSVVEMGFACVSCAASGSVAESDNMHTDSATPVRIERIFTAFP